MPGRDAGSDLIFLISQPRAGSTLLQHLLGSHSEVHTLPEPWILLHPLYALRAAGVRAEFDAGLAHEALLEFLRRIGADESLYLEQVRRTARTLYDAALSGTGKTRFLDKTPRYFHVLPELRTLFPEAKVVFLVRNPLAVLTSIFDLWDRRGGNLIELFATDARHDLTTAPVRIAEAMRTVFPDAPSVRYEDLVTRPEPEVRGLCERLDLDFEPGMLDYGDKLRFRGKAFGDDKSIRNHDRPVTRYRDAWTGRLDTPFKLQIARRYLSSLGDDLVSDLGYDPREIRRSLAAVRVPGSWRPAVPWRSLNRDRESLRTWERAMLKAFQKLHGLKRTS